MVWMVGIYSAHCAVHCIVITTGIKPSSMSPVHLCRLCTPCGRSSELGLCQTYTSAHLFDTLVTGLAHCAVHRRGRVREQLGDSSEIHQRRVRRIDLKYTTSGSRFLHSFVSKQFSSLIFLMFPFYWSSTPELLITPFSNISVDWFWFLTDKTMAPHGQIFSMIHLVECCGWPC